MKKLFNTPLSTVLIALVIILSQVSCEKDNDQDPNTDTYPIEGLWIGTYTVNGQPGLGNQYYSFVIKPDGTLIQDGKAANQQAICIGTWTLTGTNFSANFTSIWGVSGVGVVQNVTANWDNKGHLTSGVWSNPPPGTGSGTFTMSRVN